MAKLLFIDTSRQTSLLMLGNGQEVLASRSNDTAQDHARLLNVHLAQLLEETGSAWKDLRAIAVLNGPGSYTGLRIGLASAKGLCYALDLPLILVHQLNVLHRANGLKEGSAYILLARADEYFFKSFSSKGVTEALLDGQSLKELSEKEQFSLFTSDPGLTAIFPSCKLLDSDPGLMYREALELWQQQNFAPLPSSEPFYMKNVYINKINKL